MVYLKSRRPEMFWEKRVLRDFTKFTGKHLLTIKTTDRRFGAFIVNYEA